MLFYQHPRSVGSVRLFACKAVMPQPNLLFIHESKVLKQLCHMLVFYCSMVRWG